MVMWLDYSGTYSTTQLPQNMQNHTLKAMTLTVYKLHTSGNLTLKIRL